MASIIKKNHKIVYLAILLIIFLFALWIRTTHLNSIPSGFHQDEAANAYMGKFVFINGKDFYGNRWPIFYFNKWGDYPPVIPMYFAGLGSLIFGNTPFGARIVFAFLGALTVIPIYFLAKHLLENSLAALAASFFLSILPWHVAFSRTAAEGILALFFYITGLTFYFSRKQKYTILAVIFLLLAYLSYPSFRVIIPLTLLYFVVLEKVTSRKISKVTLLSFFGFLILTIWIAHTPWGSARFKQTSILKTVSKNQEYYNQFIYNEKSVLLARIFHNKLVNVGREFIKQYLSYFSPISLFVEGGNPQWYRFPNSGLIYLTQLVLIILFLIAPYLKKNLTLNKKSLFFILYLFIISP